MDNSLKAFYTAMLIGDCTLNKVDEWEYIMEYRMSSDDVMSVGQMTIDCDVKFDITKGLDVFKWFFARYHR